MLCQGQGACNRSAESVVLHAAQRPGANASQHPEGVPPPDPLFSSGAHRNPTQRTWAIFDPISSNPSFSTADVRNLFSSIDVDGNGNLILCNLVGPEIKKKTFGGSAFTTLYAGTPFTNIAAGALDLQTGDLMAVDFGGILRARLSGTVKLSTVLTPIPQSRNGAGRHADPETATFVGWWSNGILKIPKIAQLSGLRFCAAAVTTNQGRIAVLTEAGIRARFAFGALRLATLLEHTADQLSGMNAFTDHQLAVYQHVDNPRGRLDRVLIGRLVCHLVRIEYHQIGELALFDSTSVP